MPSFIVAVKGESPDEQHWVHTLSRIHSRSFGSLRSCRKTKKTKTRSLNPLSFGSFCTTLTPQKTLCELGFPLTTSKTYRDHSKQGLKNHIQLVLGNIIS